MNSELTIIVVIAVLGCVAGGGIVAVRAVDQRGRDQRRTDVVVSFPRGLTDRQVLAVGRIVVGLATNRNGLGGQDSVVFEVVGTDRAITHRLRLPASAATYITAQIRTTVPGIAMTEEMELTVTKPSKSTARKTISVADVTAGVKLSRRQTDADLAVGKLVEISRAIITATTQLYRHEVVVWQLVVCGGICPRPPARPRLVELLSTGRPTAKSKAVDLGVMRVAVRLGATARTPRRTAELLSRLRRAASTVSAPQARLVPRLLSQGLVARWIRRGTTPLLASSVLLTVEEFAGLMAWPLDSPLIGNLSLGGSPQLPAAPIVPRTGRVLGLASVGDRPVAQSVAAGRLHTLIAGPTGSGKSWLAARWALDDIEARRCVISIDPKGSTNQAILDRAPADAIGRIIVVDPLDLARPVPMPLLSDQLSADAVVQLLKHRFGDLGPRSSDIISASLYALARRPGSTIMDLLPLWTDVSFRSQVAGIVADDPILASFFGWFEALGTAERSSVLAAPMNKIRPLLQRVGVRNIIAAPRSTFSMAEVMRDKLVVLVNLPEGELGADATTLLGQAVVGQVWAATQSRVARTPVSFLIDEAARFVDSPVDLGEMLARSREYGVGIELLVQSINMFPSKLRDIALNSARTKIGFGTSAADAKRLAAEFGPGVEADYFTGLGPYEAIGQVALEASVSPAFTFRTEALGPVIPGRAKAIRAASRAKWGVPREEIEAAWKRSTGTDESPGGTPGPIGRRPKR